MYECTCPHPTAQGTGAVHAGQPRRTGTVGSRFSWLRRWVSPAVIVLAWQVLSSTGILSEQTIASPAQIATRAGQLAADGTLGAATLTSVQRVLIGFAVGAAFGLVLAVLAGLSRIGEDVVDPPMQMLRTLPHFGLIPLFIVWMGIGESPKIALIAMGCGVPALSEHLRRNPQHRPADDGGRGDDGPDPPPAPTSRGDPGRPPAGARGTSAEPRSRLAHADRRRDDQCRLRPRLHDQQRSRVPADRHHRGRPSRLQHPGPRHRCARPTHREKGAGLALLTGNPVAQVRGHHRSFGATRVLRGVDLTVHRGEFVALLGRSGSGKSTLLRSLAGLDPSPRDEVLVSGRTTVSFQEPRLLPWRKVRQNVEFAALNTVASGSRAARVRDALAEVSLTEKLDAWPGQLSGGQASSFSLARALVNEPDLLLLDEPFSALDALTRMERHSLDTQLWERRRPAILLVTHDVDEALALADRVLVLDGGDMAREWEVPLRRTSRSPEHGQIAQLREEVLGSLGVSPAHETHTSAPHDPFERGAA